MTGKQGQVWFITGTSTGFGRLLAEKILAQNDCVVATARDPKTLADLERQAPDRVLPLRLDVTVPAEITAAVKAADARFGRIDKLVNNAGYGFLSGVEEANEDEIQAQFAVNFFGLLGVTRAVLPLMRRQRDGFIINISSIAGFTGMLGSGLYSASKFAVEGLSEALAQELKPFGIRVMIVEPSAFRTEFFGRSMSAPAHPLPDYRHTAEMRTALKSRDGKQAGDPVKAAAAIVEAVAHPSPPMRLVLGKAAWETITRVQAERGKDIEWSRAIAQSCDYPS